jgi:hypothetical protein
MEEDDMSFLDDFFKEEKESNFDYLELFEYIVNNKKFNMELTEFLVVESGFREVWNSKSGELIGDGQFKNYVYRHIEKQIENKKILEPIPQKDVDECIDLILEYMSLIGQYKSDFSDS